MRQQAFCRILSSIGVEDAADIVNVERWSGRRSSGARLWRNSIDKQRAMELASLDFSLGNVRHRLLRRVGLRTLNWVSGGFYWLDCE